MKEIRSGITSRVTGRLGVELNNISRDIRSLVPRHVPGAYVSHTSEGVTIRPKAQATEESRPASSSQAYWA